MTAPATPIDQGPSTASDRGISPISGRFGFGRAGKAATVLALAAGCGVFMLATARHPAAKAAEAQTPARQVVAFEPAAQDAAPTLAHPGADAPQLGGAGPASASGAVTAPTTGLRTRAASGGAVQDAPILAFTRSQEAGAALPPVMAGASGPLPAPEPSELDRLRTSAGVGTARASRLADRSFLILAGTSIPCVLQTAMDSAAPGYVTCVVPTDVYSENGAVVLLEKGTKVLGEYRGGLKQGQSRLFVVWTRAVTPGGVAIHLASPAADALGRAGFDGDVDSQFWQRFGGAVLLSVIDNGLGALGRGAGSVNIQAPSTAATTALQGSIGIAPTLRKPPGALVSIFAAEDFDFSGVYGVAGR
jgi:type IV secretion system protein VirB10